ncbi:uncharacterized protein LOC128928958 [Callithrix jacchus]
MNLVICSKIPSNQRPKYTSKKQPRAPAPSSAGLRDWDQAGARRAPPGSPHAPATPTLALGGRARKAWHSRRTGPQVRGPRVVWAPPPLSGQCPAECPGLRANGLESRAAERSHTGQSPSTRKPTPRTSPGTENRRCRRTRRRRRLLMESPGCCHRRRRRRRRLIYEHRRLSRPPLAEFWSLAQRPWYPPWREPRQLQRPGPIPLDPRSQDSGTRRFLLWRKIRHDLRPPPPNPPVSSRLTALLRRREDASA